MKMTEVEIENLKHRIEGCAFSMYGIMCDVVNCKDLLDLLKYIELLEKQISKDQQTGKKK